jgi:putative Ca2+/H+ antiporter (TMEM165/GDT1 family)
MDYKALLVIFGTVFLAELGDKTQLATVLFAAEGRNPALAVFVAAACALVLSTALAVAAGTLLARHVDTRLLTIVAGTGFIAIGAWTLWGAVRNGG